MCVVREKIIRIVVVNCIRFLIPESGRVFVWGENQFGQLGIGSAEIVTKPSCVKAIKTLGYRVRNVAYGKEFGVILTGQPNVLLLLLLLLSSFIYTFKMQAALLFW